MAIRERPFRNSVLIVKAYRGCKFKFSHCNRVKNHGIEDYFNYSEKGTVNDKKLDNNIYRAKQAVYELAFCNDWDYFITITIDPLKHNRDDLKAIMKKLYNTFRKYKSSNPSFKYLLIPEKHKDGVNWHLHGLISGLPASDLKQYVIGDKMGLKMAQKVQDGDILYQWCLLSKKYGFNSLEEIKSHEGVTKYITKYISKELRSSVTALSAHMYYCSKGLNRASVIFDKEIEDVTAMTSSSSCFTHDYGHTLWVESDDQANKILNSLL